MNHSFESLSVALVAALVLTACGGGGDSLVGNAGPSLIVDANGASSFASTTLSASLTALPIEVLSIAEQESLAFMREEEKLAHDVYTQLDAVWSSKTRVFGNIAKSESTHTEAISQLLVRYNLPDPAAILVAGVYQNTALQGLYTQLVTSGKTSLIGGLKVGAGIEETDMIDINKALQAVDNQDIILVYQSLLKGSRNHLRSFVSTLANQGVTYVPQYMVPADYEAIISTPIER